MKNLKYSKRVLQKLCVAFVIFMVINFLYSHAILAQIYTRPPSARILDSLAKKNPNKAHPRLFARQADFDDLRTRITANQDPNLMSMYNYMSYRVNNPEHWMYYKNLGFTDFTVDKTISGILDNKRTRGFFELIGYYAMCYRMTGNKAYADKAYRDMENAAKVISWIGTDGKYNLDTGDLMWAFAIGFDWCYDAYTTEQRAVLISAMVDKGLKPLQKNYNDNPNYSYSVGVGSAFANNNHNPWDNGGAAVAAIAIFDEDVSGSTTIKTLAGDMLSRTLRAVEPFANTYATGDADGGSLEGPGYGNGATSHYIKWLAALESSMGTDFGYFDNTPQLEKFVYFSPYLNGPVKQLAFHDAGKDYKNFMEVTFYFANKLNKPSLGRMRMTDLSSNNGYPTDTENNYQQALPRVMDLIWYKPQNYTSGNDVLPLDKYFGGQLQTGSMRSSFSDPYALFLAFHGGNNHVSHAHLDVGQFNIDAMGLNWACDLGTETYTYNIPNPKFTTQKWLYRISPEGHNTLLIDPKNNEDGQFAEYDISNNITSFVSKPAGAFAVMDMSQAYKNKVTIAKRGFALIAGRTKIIIQDEVKPKANYNLYWSMHTRATSIDISADGKTAILTQEGKRMRARLLLPATAKFKELLAEPLPNPESYQYSPQTENKGIKKLSIKLALTANTNTTIKIEFLPIYKESDLNLPDSPNIPLSNWNDNNANAIINDNVVKKLPEISYLPASINYKNGQTIANLLPTNTGAGVPEQIYGDASFSAIPVAGQVQGLTFNADGTILYAANSSFKVQKITNLSTNNPVISNLAGYDTMGFEDGLDAGFTKPFSVAIDPITSKIYVTDVGFNSNLNSTNNNVNLIRRIDPTTGSVETIGGILGAAASALAVAGVNAAETNFNSPKGLVFDELGNLYVAEPTRIIKIDPNNTVSFVATSLINCYNIAYSKGSLYVSEVGNTSTPSTGHRIYRIDISNNNSKTILAGTGFKNTTGGTGDGAGIYAQFNGPRGIAVDSTGNTYVADYAGLSVRKITPEGIVSTIVGNGNLDLTPESKLSQIGTLAEIKYPAGLALDGKGFLYVGEAGTNSIRKISVAGYTISPALPDGLIFDSTTGKISGTPTVNSALTTYTITAYNGAGSAFTTLNIAVLSILPIKFGAISAKNKEADVEVKWQSLTEVDVKEYQVERSTDGQVFSKAGTVVASGKTEYSFLDVNPLGATLYYRVIAVDNSGEQNSSKIVAVKRSFTNYLTVKIYPNPVDQKVANVLINYDQAAVYTLKVIDTAGKTILSKKIQHHGASASYAVELPANISTGVYTFSIQSAANQYTQKVIIN